MKPAKAAIVRRLGYDPMEKTAAVASFKSSTNRQQQSPVKMEKLADAELASKALAKLGR